MQLFIKKEGQLALYLLNIVEQFNGKYYYYLISKGLSTSPQAEINLL
jgi:hypothetical protein